MRKTVLALILVLLCAAASWAVTPQITVSATAVTILGTSQTISMTVTLIDPQQTGNLRISGTGIIPVMQASTVTPGNTATVGPIWGNDVVLDAFGNPDTYYKVQVFTVTGGIIASTPSLQAYFAFIGSGTIDVSSATPLSPSFQTGTSGNVVLPGTLSVSGLITATGGVAGIGPHFQQFTSSGTFTIPAGVTSVRITVLAGGGAGGGSTVANSGGGGAAGGLAFKWLSGLTPGNTLAVTVGLGGTANSGAAGSNGGASSVASGTQVISTITATGGAGGASSGTISSGGGTSPGSGGDQNVGSRALQGNGALGGNGATSLLGGGGQGASGANPGESAVTWGLGGGGGGSGNGSTQSGGVGAPGVVIFEWVN